MYTPAASDVWSNPSYDRVHSIVYGANNYYFDENEVIDKSEDGEGENVNPNMIENSVFYANQLLSDYNPGRVAPPFPDSKNADQYKPPHQFYTTNCQSFSNVFTRDKNIISQGLPRNIDKRDAVEKNLDYSSKENGCRLQRPSSFQDTLHHTNGNPYFHFYASVPFLEGNFEATRPIINPCSAIPSNVESHCCSDPNTSIEPFGGSQKTNTILSGNMTNPYVNSYSINIKSCESPNFVVNCRSKIDQPELVYANLIDYENYEDNGVIENGASGVHANSQKNQYNCRSKKVASVYDNHLNKIHNYGNQKIKELPDITRVSLEYIFYLSYLN